MISPKKSTAKTEPRRAKRVTLISAARTPEGIVIHSDSQETVGDYRVEIDKIKSEKMGQFQVLVAGAGAPGNLVDSFSPRLRRRVTDKVSSLKAFAFLAEKELRRFYELDVELCPTEGKNVTYLIAASHPESATYEAWITNNIVLEPIPAVFPILIGWEEELYKAVAKRLYSSAMSTQQSILAGVFLLTLAEESSNYVKSPIKIAVVNEFGITLDETDYHRRIQDRLRAYDRSANQVFLKCADTTVSLPALEDSINQFRQAALDLHRDQIDELARKATLFDFARGNPLRKLPFVPMMMLDSGGFTVEHDRKAIEQAEAEREAVRRWLKEHGIEYLTKPVVCSKCQHQFEIKMECGGPHDHTFMGSCPNCGEGNLVEWVFRSGAFS